MNLDDATTEYDAAFRNVQGLTWLPWVGQRYSDRPIQKRLFVIGESHYYNGETPEERHANREKWLIYPKYTRDVVSESLVNYEWTTRTLDTIPRLLFKTTDIDRPRLWAASAYYNLVQRMMDYKQDGSPERPTWDDYMKGWKVFGEVVKIIQPSHCLFIGVTAANSFNHWIEVRLDSQATSLSQRRLAELGRDQGILKRSKNPRSLSSSNISDCRLIGFDGTIT